MMENPVNPVVTTYPNQTPEVPSDWASLGAEAGYNPRLAEKLRLFIVGPSGEGKTTFDASIPRNLILDTEKGANTCTGSRATYIPIENYAHLMKIRDKLLEDAKNGVRHWDRITVDTIDEFIAIIKQQLEFEKKVEDITDYRSEGYGYNLIMQRFWSLVLDLEQAGYVWAFVGHLKTKTEMNPVTKKPETKIREAVYPGIAGKIKGQCDFKLTIYCLPQEKKITGPPRVLGDGRVLPGREETVTVKTYYLDSCTNAERDSKARGVPTMDDRFEIPLVNGWDEFARRYNSAVEVEKAKYK